jgi:hypothetical protein
VLNALAGALQLDDAERAHLFDLARAVQPAVSPPRRRPARQRVRPAVQHILDAMTGAAAFVRNDRLDILGGNQLGCARPPAATPTTATSPTSSASCPRRASRSARTGHRTTSASTSTASSGSTTRSWGS